MDFRSIKKTTVTELHFFASSVKLTPGDYSQVNGRAVDTI